MSDPNQNRTRSEHLCALHSLRRKPRDPAPCPELGAIRPEGPVAPYGSIDHPQKIRRHDAPSACIACWSSTKPVRSAASRLGLRTMRPVDHSLRSARCPTLAGRMTVRCTGRDSWSNATRPALRRLVPPRANAAFAADQCPRLMREPWTETLPAMRYHGKCRANPASILVDPLSRLRLWPHSRPTNFRVRVNGCGATVWAVGGCEMRAGACSLRQQSTDDACRLEQNFNVTHYPHRRCWLKSRTLFPRDWTRSC